MYAVYGEAVHMHFHITENHSCNERLSTALLADCNPDKHTVLYSIFSDNLTSLFFSAVGPVKVTFNSLGFSFERVTCPQSQFWTKVVLILYFTHKVRLCQSGRLCRAFTQSGFESMRKGDEQGI